MIAATVERFITKINFIEDGCWIWTRATDGNGYGVFQLEGRARASHRLAYELWNGPIPNGLCLDHLCRVKRCVNPDHLEAVSYRENTLRGISPVARNASATVCKNGHPLTPANTRCTIGKEQTLKRACRQCLILTKRRWRARNPGVR
jgi:hypothetical protein